MFAGDGFGWQSFAGWFWQPQTALVPPQPSMGGSGGRTVAMLANVLPEVDTDMQEIADLVTLGLL